MRRALLAARMTIALVLGFALALAHGTPVAGAAQTLPCNLTQWTGTSFDTFPLYRLANSYAHFDPQSLPGDGPITVSIAGSSITVAIDETFTGLVTEVSHIGFVPVTRDATVTAQAELTGHLAQVTPTQAGGSFTASVNGTSTLEATGFTYSGTPLSSSAERTVSVTGSVDCAAGQLRLTSKLYFVFHTSTLYGPGSAPQIAALPTNEAETFENSQYQSTVLDQPLRLYRRYGGNSPKLGSFWSRTNFTSANDAKQNLALPPGNTATSRVVIVVPKGTEVYWGQAAPQPQWSELGGGDQVVFPDGFRIQARWIKRR
jgi:hypothetical protein